VSRQVSVVVVENGNHRRGVRSIVTCGCERDETWVTVRNAFRKCQMACKRNALNESFYKFETTCACLNITTDRC
jgi:hypothetical protein